MIEEITYESSLFVVLLAWLIMSTLKKSVESTSNLRSDLSEAILMINLIYNFFPLLFIGVKLFIFCIKTYKLSVKPKRKQSNNKIQHCEVL